MKANAGLLAEALKTKRPREEEDKGADAKRLTVVDTMYKTVEEQLHGHTVQADSCLVD